MTALHDVPADGGTRLLQGFAGAELEDVVDSLGRADGAIVVTPIFNTGYSGLFKFFFDTVDPDALRGLPVLLGATGGTGRHSLAIEYALRPLFTYLHALPVASGVYAATSDWGTPAPSASGGSDGSGASGASSGLAGRIDRAAAELVRETMRPDSDQVRRRPDPFALPVGFDPSGRTSP